MEFTYDQLVKYGFESHDKPKKCKSCKSKFNIMRNRTHIMPNMKGYQCYNCFSDSHRAPSIFTTKAPIPIFEQMVSGLKKSFVELANRDYEIGDTLIFQEYDAINKNDSGNELITEITGILDIEQIYTAEDIWEFGINLIDYKKKNLYEYQEDAEFKIHDCIENLDECVVVSPQTHNGRDIRRPKWHLVEKLTKKILVEDISGCPFCIKKTSNF
ncbi:MAG: hypothetical protein HeimC2_21110 [Candidatus Heimdallarchaeota archaeon LC_2]|nr:MAG: hypothetical protein HeimC2_21110 [Candidatus Heimdallarchaeota archaeon LC_2]